MNVFTAENVRRHWDDPVYLAAWADWLEETGSPYAAVVRAVAGGTLGLWYDEVTVIAWQNRWDFFLPAGTARPAGSRCTDYGLLDRRLTAWVRWQGRVRLSYATLEQGLDDLTRCWRELDLEDTGTG